MEEINCYICNETIRRKFVHQITTTHTKHTNIPISELIEKFLESTTYSLQLTKDDVVCANCVEQLNEYDLASDTAMRIEQKITETLLISAETIRKETEEELIEFLDSEEENAQNIYRIAYDEKNDNPSQLSLTIELMPDEKVTQEIDSDEEEEEYENLVCNNDSKNSSENDLTIKTNYMCESRNQEFETLKKREEHRKDYCLEKNQLNDGDNNKHSFFGECPDCYEIFTSRKLLKLHCMRFHTPKKCGICQQIFANKFKLKEHNQSNHELQSNQKCNACNKCFSNQFSLLDHIKEHKNDNKNQSLFNTDESNTLHCKFCNGIENTENDLKKHVALHDNKFKCVICGTVVKYKGNLILHMRIHSGDKFFQCDKCGKKFVHKSSLRMHLQTTHSDVRRKQCVECPLKFKTTSQLNQHILTHTGVKNHRCPECSKSFTQRYNMMAHYKLHSAGNRSKRKKMCKCMICNAEFHRPSLLKNHSARVHDVVIFNNNDSIKNSNNDIS